MEHLGPERLASFIAGQLPPADAQAVELHIDVCSTCREALSDIVRQRSQDQGLATTQVATLHDALPWSVGDVVEGRFRIERLLGVGGMGYVFEAHHLHLNQPVAVKFLLPAFAKDASVVDRLRREARAAARLKTEHVGRALDFGTLSDGTPYLVMEYLEGETVDRRLTREGPFELRTAALIVHDACLALEEAHAIGIVHRDIKPSNLFWARRSNGTEVLKVLDFGIAKSVHPEIEEGLGTTSGKMLLGTPFYMAPEQLTPGKSIDGRADVWALGCVLHQLLSGGLPFEGRDLVDLMYAIARSPHRRLKGKGAAVAPIIDRCLAKEPEQRFRSVLELRLALQATLAAEAKPAPSPSGKKASLVLVGTGVALALGGAGWLYFSSPQPAPGPTPKAPMPSVVAAPPEPSVPVVETIRSERPSQETPDAGGGPASVRSPLGTSSSQGKTSGTGPRQQPPPKLHPVDLLDERL